MTRIRTELSRITEKHLEANILQPHGVEHACRGLSEPRWGMALAGFACQRLSHERPEPLQADGPGKFQSIAKRPRRRYDGVRERQ